MFSASKTKGVSGFQITNSLRFRSSASAYLNRTPSVAGNRQTWTWSGWVKRGLLASAGLFQSSGAGGFGVDGSIGFASDTVDFIFDYNAGSRWRLTTTQVLRDPSAWYHLIIVADTTNATSTDRLRLYINGNRVTAFSTANYPTLNANGTLNQAYLHNIGYSPSVAYFDGYLTEINFIDGQALTPSSFGQYDANGVWQPKAYTGTYGTNGFRLNFSNGTSTTTLGYDSSGRGNNWTTNNISLTAGSTYDWMIDSPTSFAGTSYGVGNYCVLNPLAISSSGTAAFSNGNLTATGPGTAAYRNIESTIQVTSGKWYWEATITSLVTDAGVGVGTIRVNSFREYLYNGNKSNGASSVAYGASYTTGDVIGVALDMDGNSLTFYKNGVSQGVAYTDVVSLGSVQAVGYIYNTGVQNYNFGQRPFAFSVPSGYKSLCTYNLPAPSIVNGASYMAATIYTGNNTTNTVANTVNNVSFQPDLVWIKSRSAVTSHMLLDSVRPNGYSLNTNTTNSEGNLNGPWTGFASNGFTLSSDGTNTVNGSATTYVGWQWKAGGTAVTNTAGSITSQVSANTTAGFSVVTYTGTGSAGTIGHGLGVAPAMIIVKNRTTAATSWITYHASLPTPATQALYLNTTDSVQTSALFWNSTAPTSSVFSVAAYNPTNQSTNGIVAYCFAAIPGYSAFGSYTGNGSADGVFIYLGFRPRYIMFKLTSTTGDWQVWDSSRDPYNVVGNLLNPNLSSAEQTGQYSLDFLSNGVKFRSGTIGNNSGQTYIYAAFAENPFQNALAR